MHKFILQIRKSIYILTAAIILLITSTSSHAVDTKLCAPFKQLADNAAIENMQKAAKFDQLFRIRQATSKMRFRIQSSVGVVEGDFKNFEGGIALNGKSSQTMISVDVSSLNTNMLFIENLLKSDTFLDIDNHPKLIFISSGFYWLNPYRAVLKGKLTIRGITKDVAFYIDILNDDSEVGNANIILVNASTTILRSEFGMSSMSPLLSDKIHLSMSVVAERYTAI